MKLLLIQTRHDGPWRWAAIDQSGACVATSAQEYSSAGRARSAGRGILRRLAALDAAGRWAECPSLQLELFPPLDRVNGQREVKP